MPEFLDPGLALDRRLDEVAPLSGDRGEGAEHGAEGDADADQQRAGDGADQYRGDRSCHRTLQRFARRDRVEEGMPPERGPDEEGGGVADHRAGEREDDEPEPQMCRVGRVPPVDRHPEPEAEADVGGAADRERPAGETLAVPRPASRPTTAAAANAQSAAMSDAGRTNRIPSQTLSGRINHAAAGSARSARGARAAPMRRSTHPAPTTAATAGVPIQSAATMTPTSTSPDTTLRARFIPPGWRADTVTAWAGTRSTGSGMAPNFRSRLEKSESASWIAVSPKSGHSVSVT